jgi:uncharacterized protein (TIGR03083 family)
MDRAALPFPAALAHLETAATVFAAALTSADLAAPVASCPGWDLRRLACHLGGVHRWARTAITEGRSGELREEGPGDPGGLRDWFDEGVRDLVDTLGTSDPARECWTFGPRPHTTAFWIRRMPHETWMHAWDAASAAPDPVTVPHDLALDGVDEVVHMFVPRQIRLGRLGPLQSTIELRATDAPGEPAWLLASGDRSASPDAVVSAPADVLLLLLWHRLPADHPEVRIDGDAAAARRVITSALTP